MDQQQFIRNFAIIAHIDHGKSTLADRLMEMTGTVAMRDMQAQLLDSNPIERERGITIKLAPVRMLYSSRLTSHVSHVTSSGGDTRYEIRDTTKKSEQYILNLIDTPGHVDFGYEVSRSLAACEGALLVVDATQGVQAQTLANLHQARLNNLTIIPLINKIDMPTARIDETKMELFDLGFTNEDILCISAKTGANVDMVLQTIVEKIPPPVGETNAPTRALVFSSQYDPHKGVIVFVRVVDGEIKGQGSGGRGQEKRQRLVSGPLSLVSKIRFLNSGAEVVPIEVGYFNPKMVESAGLETGEVGYIATGLKDVKLAKVGDTITTLQSDNASKLHRENASIALDTLRHCGSAAVQPLPGYKEPKPMVFVGLYPIEQEEFSKARVAMGKLRLSDSAFTFRPVSSLALGNGFHCGFLGLLHAEIVQERLSREFGLSLLATAPSVEYLVQLKSGVNPSKAGIVHSLQQTDNSSQITVHSKQSFSVNHEIITVNFHSITSATEFPDPSFIESVKEPVMQVTIYSPKRYVGAIMGLAQDKRGEYVDLVYRADNAEFTYLIPLSEMIVDFFDRLKSVTEGYASLDYEFFEFKNVDAVRVDILVNHEKVDALAFLVNREAATKRAHDIVDKLATVLPRQQFNIPVQGAIGGTIIARADIKPYRKDVIAKLYGGDRTRKDKLLKKQKKGKEKMKRIGSVEIPQDAFFEVLKTRK